MTELSRSLLAAAREGLAPDAAMAARVRAKVAAAVTTGALGGIGATSAIGATSMTGATSTTSATSATSTTGATSTTSATSATSAASAASTTGATSATGTTGATSTNGATYGTAGLPAVKAGSAAALLELGALLVVVGAVTATIAATDFARAPEAPRVTLPTTSDPDEVRTEVRVGAPNDPLPVSAPPRTRSKHAAPAPAESPMLPPDAPVEPASLAREVELIDLAMMSLRKNAPAAAIEAIRVFERETLGHGQMAEDAAAIEIEARCKLHEDVSEALARFDRTWPSSAQRERIQTTCFARR
jgi:hypothetical protein